MWQRDLKYHFMYTVIPHPYTKHSFRVHLCTFREYESNTKPIRRTQSNTSTHYVYRNAGIKRTYKENEIENRAKKRHQTEVSTMQFPSRGISF